MCMDKPTTAEIARFFDKVLITDSCWLWISALDKDGYGKLKFHQKQFQAHRFSYELFVGPIELGKYILHRKECGNRNCVNPHHLYMGTPADNVKDRQTWGKLVRGEDHGNARLSEKDVLDIRRIHKDKQITFKNTADLFGISPTYVGQIVSGKNWKHLINPPILCTICRKETAVVGGLCIGCDHLMGDVLLDQAGPITNRRTI